MEQTDSSQSFNSVYPGEYIPLKDKQQFLDDVKRSAENGAVLPEFIVTELEDLIKVELNIAGMNREDFLVQANGNVLSVFIVHTTEVSNDPTIHDLKYHCFERHCVLEDHVDVEFGIAEYRNEKLSMYFPKVKGTTRNHETTIVVY